MIKKTKGLTFFLFIYGALVLSLALISYAATGGRPKFVFRFKTVVIDAGHGGKDPGASGAYSFEKNVTLAIAKKVQQLLKTDMTDINVVMTRNTDKFVELNRRSEIANENQANLFISIHCNSSPEGTGQKADKEKGVMMLVYGFHRREEQREALRENASIYIEKDYKKKYDGYSNEDPTTNETQALVNFE